ncbi:hypothetical protein PIB30_060158 [Stylosanthes scabra]|uniref:Uncharacterized protein n=1 Tax=Stylosanthes scabra TaxID=79078 RepID=A0ABU6VJS1_9FABA|nr:hypothetical protein [Stylosanthes scabra]
MQILNRYTDRHPEVHSPKINQIPDPQDTPASDREIRTRALTVDDVVDDGAGSSTGCSSEGIDRSMARNAGAVVEPAMAAIIAEATSHKVEIMTDAVTGARSGAEDGASAEGMRRTFVTPVDGAVTMTNRGRQAWPLRRIVLLKPPPLLAAVFHGTAVATEKNEAATDCSGG